MTERRELYPEIEATTGFLQVDDVHNIYYEECGSGPQPVVIFHGGPGGGSSPIYRRFFDPSAYRIIQFDQRGAGKSTPYASLEKNTTWDLVEDTEKLRKHLGIEKWVVFGGSWGSTLALSYAQKHADRVKALILRGIFTLRRSELLFFYQDGASHLFPDAWEKFLEPIPVVERHDLMSAYHRRLTGPDAEERRKCAMAWTIWELSTSRLYVDPAYIDKADDMAEAFARIESHYFVNGGFFEYDGQLIAEANKLNDIPGVIVQGRYDVVCPAKSAWELHKNWTNSELHIIPDAGHSCIEPGVIDQLVRGADKFKTIGL
eukprot:TRINITY_DN4565_c0_g1_i1.p1 TRINITY_DN4565_c0_g1~~TRINITY_DN4565_c0_g1_i1.p1  ORF type:complete len:324 (-),score=71.04 TRINITY_DN4565_c0_g1_i1:106-1056(-)